MSYAWKMRLGAVASWALLIGLALLGLVFWSVRSLRGLLGLPVVP